MDLLGKKVLVAGCGKERTRSRRTLAESGSRSRFV